MGWEKHTSDTQPSPTSAAEWSAHRLRNLASWVRFPVGPGPGLRSGDRLRKVRWGVRTEWRKRPGQADCKDSCPCALPPLHAWATPATSPQVRNQLSSVHPADVFLPSHFIRRSVGPMDKASAPGAGDSRFESWADHAHGQCHARSVEYALVS